MKRQIMKKLFFVFLIVFTSCMSNEDKTNFSKKALADVMIDLKGNEITFGEIMNQYKGRKVVIDVWASWCGDCIAGMPKVKELQREYPDAIYLFLSLDKDLKSWQRGIKKRNIIGEHYFIPGGWKSDFNTSIELDWIPRYIVVDASGNIQLFKAKVATDENLEKAIKN